MRGELELLSGSEPEDGVFVSLAVVPEQTLEGVIGRINKEGLGPCRGAISGRCACTRRGVGVVAVSTRGRLCIEK